MSQVRLVLASQTGSEEAPTGAQQVPKRLEGARSVPDLYIETFYTLTQTHADQVRGSNIELDGKHNIFAHTGIRILCFFSCF